MTRLRTHNRRALRAECRRVVTAKAIAWREKYRRQYYWMAWDFGIEYPRLTDVRPISVSPDGADGFSLMVESMIEPLTPAQQSALLSNMLHESMVAPPWRDNLSPNIVLDSKRYRKD